MFRYVWNNLTDFFSSTNPKWCPNPRDQGQYLRTGSVFEGYVTVCFWGPVIPNLIFGGFFFGGTQEWFYYVPARWAPTSYKWSYSHHKWFYKWITGFISPLYICIRGSSQNGIFLEDHPRTRKWWSDHPPFISHESNGYLVSGSYNNPILRVTTTINMVIKHLQVLGWSSK